jgi:hypothetical protein
MFAGTTAERALTGRVGIASFYRAVRFVHQHLTRERTPELTLHPWSLESSSRSSLPVTRRGRSAPDEVTAGHLRQEVR